MADNNCHRKYTNMLADILPRRTSSATTPSYLDVNDIKIEEVDAADMKTDPDFTLEFHSRSNPSSELINTMKSVDVDSPAGSSGFYADDPGEGTSSGQSCSNPFSVDRSRITAIAQVNQASELQDLGLTVFDQEQFEQDVMAQVDHALAMEEIERQRKAAEKELISITDDRRLISQELKSIERILAMLTSQPASKEVTRRLKTVTQQQVLKLKQMNKLKARQKSLTLRVNGSLDSLEQEGQDEDGNMAGSSLLEQALMGQVESEYERMIRLGEMTPFGTVMSFQEPALPPPPPPPPKPRTLTAGVSEFDDFLRGQQTKAINKTKHVNKVKRKSNVATSSTDATHENKITQKKHESRKKLSESQSDPKIQNNSKDRHSFDARDKNLQLLKGSENIFDMKDKRHYRPTEADYSNVKPGRQKTPRFKHNFSEDGMLEDFTVGDEDDDDVLPVGDDEYEPEFEVDDDSSGMVCPSKNKKSKIADVDVSDEEFRSMISGKKKKKKRMFSRSRSHKDDGSFEEYMKRLNHIAKDKLRDRAERGSDSDGEVELDHAFKVPSKIWNKLYRYQKTCVRWLWELHCQQAGGIIGDEMGLGKTIQMISFLVALKHSDIRDKGASAKFRGLGPTIIVTPATVMHQWVKEFHKWAPTFRVAVLHNTGSYTSTEDALVYSIVNCNGILITGYSSLVLRQEILLKHDWHYIILDEGHKIRNPDAQVTIACKSFRTCHRIILSGSPMQNNLKELWSLFDFVFPGKLGTLPEFMAHFSVPIVQGGYSNATDVQVRTAYKCACVLRDTINPYLLRRMKIDVQSSIQLPDKNEQVLFCRLTEHQRGVYKEYLQSRECTHILDGNFLVFPGLITLRKICNHPDLSTGGPKVFDPDLANSGDPTLEYGFWKRAGKMIVVESLLKIWKKQGHRVLLFSQSKQMLDVIETFVQDQEYTYLRMDGGTTISARQPMIQKYNEDESIFVFILTTRVGGLGVNLTGANRVIIYDPDWNPSTDTQARERAWRIGQNKQVTIYRLLTSGTIEEKIYHRQIFKQFLTNRILKDPKQRRFFKTNDLYDLFSLGDEDGANTETSAIFAGTGSDVRVKRKSRLKSKKQSSSRGLNSKQNRFDALREKEEKAGIHREDWSGDLEEGDKETIEVDSRSETEIKLAKMREMAKKLSMKLSGKDNTSCENSEKIGDICEAEKDLAMETDSGQISNHKKKHSKNKKKRHKQKKDAEIDGEKISNLDRHSTFQRSTEEDDNVNSDDYVLEKLFKKKGVHSALQHDKIMMSSDPDFALVEGEAERVAIEAARALRRSRAQCNRAVTGIPTWTGQSGAQPPPKPRFGQKKNSRLLPASETKLKKPAATETRPSMKPSKSAPLFDGSLAGNQATSTATSTSSADVMTSDQLLSRMKHRNIFDKNAEISQSEDAYGNPNENISTDLEAEDMELMTDIRNAIAFGSSTDGQATTQELLDQFGPRLQPGDAAKFKAMLQSICDFHKTDKIGIWRLRPEFR